MEADSELADGQDPCSILDWARLERVVRTAIASTVSGTDLDDLVQSTLVEVVEAVGKGRRPNKGWLVYSRGVAGNVCRDWLAAQVTRANRFVLLGDEASEFEARVTDHELRHGFRAWINAVLANFADEFPPRQRAVMAAIAGGVASTKAVARTTGIDPVDVREVMDALARRLAALSVKFPVPPPPPKGGLVGWRWAPHDRCIIGGRSELPTECSTV